MKTANGSNHEWVLMLQKHHATSLFALLRFCNPISSSSPMRAWMSAFATIPSSLPTRTSASTPALPLSTKTAMPWARSASSTGRRANWRPSKREALKALSRLVIAQLEFRRNLLLLKEALTDRTKEEHERQRELVHVQESLMRVMGLRQR